jgi:hypothetical protein
VGGGAGVTIPLDDPTFERVTVWGDRKTGLVEPEMTLRPRRSINDETLASLISNVLGIIPHVEVTDAVLGKRRWSFKISYGSVATIQDSVLHICTDQRGPGRSNCAAAFNRISNLRNPHFEQPALIDSPPVKIDYGAPGMKGFSDSVRRLEGTVRSLE